MTPDLQRWGVSQPGFPRRCAVVTPSDTTDLPFPGFVRADETGQVTALPYDSTSSVVMNLVAGEFLPFLVKRVYDTGTDNITLHVSY